MDLSAVTRDVVVPVRRDTAGVDGPTPGEARGPNWRRSSRGLYVPAGLWTDTPEQRIVEAAAVLPDDWGGVTGWAALAWMGAHWFDGSPWGGGRPRPVVLAVGGNRAIRPQAGIDTSEERLRPDELVVVDGLRVTGPARSVCFEMRYARDVRDAATTLDMACFNDVVSIQEVADEADRLSGWTGIPLARDAIALANENCWSPREAGMRFVWQLDAGKPPPQCNVPVFGPDGRHLGTPDLLDPATGVVGEYDGAPHLERARRSRDVSREGVFRSHGLEYVTMLAGDVADPSGFVRRLEEAYDHAADISPARRRWTVERPEWWRDTTTVESRRALGSDLRARLLAHRAA